MLFLKQAYVGKSE